MRKIGPCPNCGGRDQRHRHTSAGMEQRGTLRPGLGGWFSSATMDVVVCIDCGLIRAFASGEAIERLRGSKDWQRL